MAMINGTKAKSLPIKEIANGTRVKYLLIPIITVSGTLEKNLLIKEMEFGMIGDQMEFIMGYY